MGDLATLLKVSNPMFAANLLNNTLDWFQNQWWFVAIAMAIALVAVAANFANNIATLFSKAPTPPENPFSAARLSSPSEYTRDGHTVKLNLIYEDRTLEYVAIHTSSWSHGIFAQHAWLHTNHPEYTYTKQVLLRVLSDGSLKAVAGVQWEDEIPAFPADLIENKSTTWLDLLHATNGIASKWFLFDVSDFLQPMEAPTDLSDIFNKARHLVNDRQTEPT